MDCSATMPASRCIPKTGQSPPMVDPMGLPAAHSRQRSNWVRFAKIARSLAQAERRWAFRAPPATRSVLFAVFWLAKPKPAKGEPSEALQSVALFARTLGCGPATIGELRPPG